MFTSALSPALAALNYTYDANGNATTDGTNCYEYNEANQLKKVKLCSNNQTIAEYIYDYNGNRIEKKLYTGGNLLKTVYSPSDTYEATKLASNGATTNVSYYFVNDELAAKKNSDGTKNYFLNDHLGSIGYLTNSAGTILETTQYYPYGLVRAGGTKNKFLYTGQENDPETGLDYYNFRYYSPQLGRFIQPDDQLQTPYDPQSLNNYSYVNNNPIRYNDPTGHYLETVVDLAFLAYDLNELKNNPGNLWNWAALGGDVAGTALPVVTGVGLGIRAVEHGGDVAKLASKLPDIGKGIKEVKETKFIKNYMRVNPKRISVGHATKDYMKLSETQKKLNPVHIHLGWDKGFIEFNKSIKYNRTTKKYAPTKYKAFWGPYIPGH